MSRPCAELLHLSTPRIRTLLENVDLCLTARNEVGLLVGVCLGLTDFAYFLFVSDLGVDRDYVRQGVGKRLLAMAHEKAGGKADVTVTTIANENAVGFYAACGFRTDDQLFVKPCREWEDFVVT